MNNGARVCAVLVILEGAYDVEFLSRLSKRLHAENPEFPDLSGGIIAAGLENCGCGRSARGLRQQREALARCL